MQQRPFLSVQTRYSLIGFFFLLLSLGSSAHGADDQINYRLKWLINASVAGDIFAQEGGFFAKHGLKVNVKPGGPEKDAIRELELGHAQFGVASADQVIRATEKGARVVVIAQLFQVNPLQWIYRSDTLALETLADLKGRKVGITYGGNDETIFRALLAKGNLKESDLSLSSVRYDYTPFLTKQVEVWPVYRNTQGIFLSDKLTSAGESVSFFNPSDFGILFVANSVITTEKMMKKHPERVQRFRRALLAGWEAAVLPENRPKIIEAIARYDHDNDRATILRQLQSTSSMVKPAADFDIGSIDREAWLQTEKIMLDQGLIKKPVNIDGKLLMP